MRRWIDENKEQYRKMLRTQCDRLKNKMVLSDYERKKLQSLENKLNGLKQ
ncbi:hypothetical protein [Paenibacillus sp. GXUN7292]